MKANHDNKRLAPGRRWFEYRCYEGEDSGDAALWHHTHQQVEVLQPLAIDEGEPAMFSVRFPDGLQYDVFDDELLANKSEYERPDYT